jgi:hypothetical protein
MSEERFDRAAAQRTFDRKLKWHREQAALPLKEKVRILLQLQKQDLPLIERLRPLEPWERPWPIEP